MRTDNQNCKTLYIFHTEFLYVRGGEKYIYEITKRLSKKYFVVLCVESINEYWTKLFEALHVTIYYLWKPKRLYWLLLPCSYVINFTRLKKFIRTTDIVFATVFPLSFLATLLTPQSIVFCFEPLSIFYDTLRIKTSSIKERFFLSIIKRSYAPLDERAVRSAHILATLNKPVARAIIQRYHRKPDVFIPNGVDAAQFSPSAPPLIKKTKYTYVLGHSTDFTVLKGTELLLRAIPLVLKQYTNVLVLISESIPNKKMLSRYRKLVTSLGIQRNVRFIGSVVEEKLPRFYTSCDCFCYCGSTKCVGGSSACLSVIESEACGIPVLRTKGNEDEIISGKTGFYFASETPTAIAQGICSYLALPINTKASFKENARQHVLKQFSWEQSVHQLESIL